MWPRPYAPISADAWMKESRFRLHRNDKDLFEIQLRAILTNGVFVALVQEFHPILTLHAPEVADNSGQRISLLSRCNTFHRCEAADASRLPWRSHSFGGEFDDRAHLQVAGIKIRIQRYDFGGAGFVAQKQTGNSRVIVIGGNSIFIGHNVGSTRFVPRLVLWRHLQNLTNLQPGGIDPRIQRDDFVVSA